MFLRRDEKSNFICSTLVYKKDLFPSGWYNKSSSEKWNVQTFTFQSTGLFLKGMPLQHVHFNVWKLFSYLFFPIWLFEEKRKKSTDLLHLSSSKIKSKSWRKQFWVQAVERKGLEWWCSLSFGHRIEDKHTTPVPNSSDLDFTSQSRQQDQIYALHYILKYNWNSV